MMFTLWYFSVATFCFVIEVKSQTMDLNPIYLQDRLEDYVTYSLRHNDMQEYLDRLTFKQNPLSGEQLLSSLVDSLEVEFKKRTDAVKRLRQAVEESYTGTTSNQIRCCDIDEGSVTYNKAFKFEIDKSRACDFLAPSSVTSPRRLSTPAFHRASELNLLDMSTLKWQYFSSNDGVTTIYPAQASDTCGSLDGRQKPWFLQAYTPTQKQFVIVIDASGSMSELYNGVVTMNLARGIAKSLLEVLNPYDQFAVMAISDHPETLSDYRDVKCFNNSLAEATPQNVREVIDFIDNITPTGGTYYASGLDEAFRFFRGLDKNATNINRVVHFISDGLPNDSPEKILEKLKRKNAEINNTVRVMTYGVGEADFSLLERMSKLNPIDAKKGVLTAAAVEDMFPDQIASTFKLFAAKNETATEPVWSLPYLHETGIGHTITASLPVHKDKTVIGVVAIDMLLKDLFHVTTTYRLNEFTYAFVTDDKGIILNHPLWPYRDDKEAHHVYATAVELDEKFQQIMNSMMRGESGNKTIRSEKVIIHGASRKYGVRTKKVLATYQWTKIPNVKFSACIVAVGDDYGVLLPQYPLSNGTFLHHRFDLIPPKKPCQHINVYSAKGQSAVLLAARAYKDENFYFNHQFTVDDIKKIADYVEGRTTESQFLKEGIKDEIIATQYAEHLWTEINENTVLQKDVVWRYLATANGVFRGYPGFQLHNDYDPTVQHWYQHAFAQRDKTISVSTPYLTSGTQAAVVTLSHVLFKRKPNTIKDPIEEEIFGVMGVDILLSHFNTIFFTVYRSCLDATRYRCLLIDTGGYVILTNKVPFDYESLKSFHGAHNWETHITLTEPEISSVLIRDKILGSNNCSNLFTGSFQRTYTIPDNLQEYKGAYEKSTFDIFSFNVVPVPETNVFLIVRLLSSDTSCNTVFFRCACANKYQKVDQACLLKGNEEDNCECPCAGANPFFNPCQSDYMKYGNVAFPCSSETENWKRTPSQNFGIVGTETFPVCYEVYFKYSEKQKEESDSQLLIPVAITGVLLSVAVVALIYKFPSISAKMQKEEKDYNRKYSDTLSMKTLSILSSESLRQGEVVSRQVRSATSYDKPPSVQSYTKVAVSYKSFASRHVPDSLTGTLQRSSSTLHGNVVTSLSDTSQHSIPEKGNLNSLQKPTMPSCQTSTNEPTLTSKTLLSNAPIIDDKPPHAEETNTSLPCHEVPMDEQSQSLPQKPTRMNDISSEDSHESTPTESYESASETDLAKRLTGKYYSLPKTSQPLNIGSRNMSFPNDLTTSATEPLNESMILGRTDSSVIDSASENAIEKPTNLQTKSQPASGVLRESVTETTNKKASTPGGSQRKSVPENTFAHSKLINQTIHSELLSHSQRPSLPVNVSTAAEGTAPSATTVDMQTPRGQLAALGSASTATSVLTNGHGKISTGVTDKSTVEDAQEGNIDEVVELFSDDENTISRTTTSDRNTFPHKLPSAAVRMRNTRKYSEPTKERNQPQRIRHKSLPAHEHSTQMQPIDLKGKSHTAMYERALSSGTDASNRVVDNDWSSNNIRKHYTESHESARRSVQRSQSDLTLSSRLSLSKQKKSTNSLNLSADENASTNSEDLPLCNGE